VWRPVLPAITLGTIFAKRLAASAEGKLYITWAAQSWSGLFIGAGRRPMLPSWAVPSRILRFSARMAWIMPSMRSSCTFNMAPISSEARAPLPAKGISVSSRPFQ
jgi:hypothetical protein